jgi:hypothetical protein
MEKAAALYLHRRETDQRSETVQARGFPGNRILSASELLQPAWNGRSRVIPIDLESGLFGMRPRDLRQRIKYRI